MVGYWLTSPLDGSALGNQHSASIRSRSGAFAADIPRNISFALRCASSY
jgi:hypothetical protein